MASIDAHRTESGGGGGGSRQRPKNRIPPRVVLGQRGESLDRRIRNIEALGSNVFIGNTLASYLALPGLVGFWPMSSVQRSTGNAYDLSGQDRTLTYNGNPTYTYYNGLIPYIDFDGTGDWLSRADETDLDILGTETIYTSSAAGLTLGGWFWFDSLSANATFIGKRGGTPGSGFAYFLQYASATTNIIFYVSSDGTALSSTGLGFTTTGAWKFIVGRFVPSTSMTVWVNESSNTDTSSIPASIVNTTGSFGIGGFAGALELLDGRAALCFLSSNSLGDDLISSLYEQSRIFFGV